MSTEYVIRPEDPQQDDVMRMLSALDKYLQSLYPPESNHILDIAALCAPDIRFWVARREGVAHGCGARRPCAAAPRDRDSPGGGARVVSQRWLRRVRPLRRLPAGSAERIHGEATGHTLSGSSSIAAICS